MEKLKNMGIYEIFNKEIEEVLNLVLDDNNIMDDLYYKTIKDIIIMTPKSELIKDYLIIQSRWSFYLTIAVLNEEFLMAKKIKRVMDIELENFCSTIKYSPEFIKIKDIKEIKELTNELRIVYNY